MQLRYDLDPAANELVRDAIARFVRDAHAAERKGIDTFHERLAAFQNPEVRTARGSDPDDFCGCEDGSRSDAAGNDLR